MAIWALRRNKAIRYVVDQLIEFHTDVTDSQRDESIPVCLNAITLSVLAGSIFIGLVSWMIV